MTNEEKFASEYLIPCGKYMFESFKDIVCNHHNGAAYLDEMLGSKSLDIETKKQLTVFLALPHIVKLVDEQIEALSEEPEENFKVPKKWYE